MRQITVSDVTIKHSSNYSGLSFRLKVEIAKALDRLGVGVIEYSHVVDEKTDYYLVKSIASSVRNATVCVAVDMMDPQSPSRTWSTLSQAVHPRLQLPVPVSTVQMEYLYHLKPSSALERIASCIRECASLCPEVEFEALDFTRSEEGFLNDAIKAAVDAGATVISLCDAAGDLLPDEFFTKVAAVKAILPQGVRLGVECVNTLYLSDACAVAAVKAGADEVKASVPGDKCVSLKRFPEIINSKSDILGVSCAIDMTRIRQDVKRIRKMCEDFLSKSPGSAVVAPERELSVQRGESRESVLRAVESLGYELTEDDKEKVFDAFCQSKSETVSDRELDVIVASVAFQVPPTYRLESYLINSGNVIKATCHISIIKDGERLEGVCVGDGPVDAAFQSIGQVTGCHYELDDFKVRSVTEGSEAMGDAVVRLRHDGKVYSGRGVSNDIIGSSIMAYLNAINKIAYGEGKE